MPDMPIFIPSLGRADRVADQTLAAIDSDRWPVFVVVPEDERDAYRQAVPNNVRVVACPERGIAATRRWIGEFAEGFGAPHFLMLDDDLQFFTRRDDTPEPRLRKATDVDVELMLAAVDHALKTGYAAVGVSARQGNNRVAEDTAENTRLIRALAFRTGPFLACEHGRVTVMEDFDVLLQLLRAGMPNLCLYQYAQDQAQTQAPGGCSTYRTHQNHEESARRLAELHPDHVKLRQKQNKTGGEFGTRTEVTIQWKRAWSDAFQWSEKDGVWYVPDTDHLDMVREARREFGSLEILETDTVLDLGAHVGGYTTYALEKGARFVYAVEPAADTWGVLCRNTTEWPNVNLYSTAVVGSDSAAVATLRLSPKHRGKGSCMASVVHARGRQESYPVPAYSFLEVVAKLRPTILKCDVEAAEHEYDWSALPDSVRAVLMEVHLSSRARRENAWQILRQLRDLGFRARGRDPKSTRWDVIGQLEKDSTWALIIIAER